jgi:purine catabolism regulator
MNLFELLRAEGLADLTVINKNANLARTVSTVESSETPDIMDYLAPNAVLITTAMAYRNNQDELCSLIESLDRLPCAAIAIKLGRFIDELDEKVIAAADERGLPLLQIPMYLTLGEVYHRILAFLWDNENENLVYTLNVQRQFYNLIHQSAALDKLTNTLGLILKSPIFILDLFGKVCASCNATRRQEKAVRNLFLNQRRDERGNGKVTRISDEENDVYLSVYPIRVADYSTNYLVMLTKESRFTSISEFALEQILLIFAIHFYKSLYNTYCEIRIRESYLQRILTQDTSGDSFSGQLLTEGQKFGVRSSSVYKVISGRLQGLDEKVFNTIRLMRRETEYILIYDLLKNRLEKGSDKNILIFPDTSDWSYVIFMQNAISDADEILKNIHDELNIAMDANIEFSHGSVVRSMGEVRISYHKAKEGFHREVSQEDSSPVRQYRPSNILEHLEYLSKEHLSIEDVCAQTLKELADPADKATADLRKTLHAYLDCHCNISDAANKLFLHRNTIRNRIRQCEEILQGDLNNAVFRLQVQLSLVFTGS